MKLYNAVGARVLIDFKIQLTSLFGLMKVARFSNNYEVNCFNVFQELSIFQG